MEKHYDTSTTVRGLLKRTGIQEYLEKSGITEIAINRAGEIFTESAQGWQRYDEPRCELNLLNQLANALAIYNSKQLNTQQPIQSVVLPDGERGQIVIPPACERDTVSITIRRPSPVRLSLEDYLSSGRLANFRDVSEHLEVPSDVLLQSWELDLLKAKAEKDIQRFLECAIQHKLNIVLVGATGSGKTTFTKALVDRVPHETRIVTIEDTHELDLPHHPNKVHLYYGKDVSPKQVVSSCMRQKPDRIFLTELRGDEAWDYITLLNTGHPGSITTVHANDCRSAYYRIASLIKQSEVGQTLDFEYIMREVMTTLDLILFFDRTYLTQLYYDPVRKWKLQRGRV
ncbi:MAG: P-type DNA transfer ATPase VirB11 [Pseudomonadota bacterium]